MGGEFHKEKSKRGAARGVLHPEKRFYLDIHKRAVVMAAGKREPNRRISPNPLPLESLPFVALLMSVMMIEPEMENGFGFVTHRHVIEKNMCRSRGDVLLEFYFNLATVTGNIMILYILTKRTNYKKTELKTRSGIQS